MLMPAYLPVFAVALAILAVAAQAAAADSNYIVNGGFEHGLDSWHATGNVGIETVLPLAGKASVRLGPGKGDVSQAYPPTPVEPMGLMIMEFRATARFSSANTAAMVRVRCYDRSRQVVMDLKQPFDSKKCSDPKGAAAGIYFKTQFNTTTITVSIEKTSEVGTAVADSVELHDYDRDRQPHDPQCDLDQYMKPIWEGETVYNESVLMLSTKGGVPSGKLLFDPSHVVAVRDSALETEFSAGQDYTVDGDRIVATPASRMTTLKDTDFPKTEYPWLNVAGKHVFVTYTHTDRWTGPIPEFERKRLPHTIAKLKGRQFTRIVAYGDSITLGINASGYRGEAPFMPPWPDLVQRQIHKLTGNPRLQMINASLGGMTSQWGKDNALDAVAKLRPDLVLIAFGMNDFWSVTPEQFRANIASIIRTVRSMHKDAEFTLVSSIRFDPAYTADPAYVGHMTGYRRELKSLVGPGIAFMDFTALSEFLYSVKNPKDLLADPMHPDDFLARLFAQSVVASLCGDVANRRTR